MAFYDLSREELHHYIPEIPEPDDFDQFWFETLKETRSYPLNPRFSRAAYHLTELESYDVSFAGSQGQEIKGWLLLPVNKKDDLACVVQFIGYGGGRGFPTDWLGWAAAGYALLVMDTRGQGSKWRKGDTPDLELQGGNPQYPGFMTRGILSRETYYYRRLITDGVRAIETARAHERIDSDKIVVTGISQGGGLAIAAASLDGRVAAAMPDVPFLCHFQRAVTITDMPPYKEIAEFCHTHRDREDQVFQVLNYFDGVHFAKRASAPAFFSTALMDQICPPSTVFAAYNAWKGKKRIETYTFNGHEGGESYQFLKQLEFLEGLGI
ncbi:acetylxylan esterase [Marispirochaeta sp.]|uniref:acetylxylan esterase n=1 Tax=Marispirochaeta sp. TaxID=2038653 RepID=UPI0029C81BC1|nr:acetylxylan esterase [Marispirochaeta sp.]